MFRLQVTIIRQTFQYVELKHVANFTLLNILLCFDYIYIYMYIYKMLFVGN